MSKSRFAIVIRATLGIGALALILAGTAQAQLAQMTSPAPGTTLPGASVTFTWTTGTNVQQYYLYVGTTIGGNDIFGSSQGTSTTATVANLPTNASPVYVRLWSYLAVASGNLTAGWHFIDYTYTAFGCTPAPATMSSPTPGTTLTGTSVLFSWTAGCDVSQYYLYVGTIMGGNDIFGTSQGTATTATVTNLPTNASTLYVRLWSYLAVASGSLTAGWHFNDYTYTASGCAPALATMSSPTPGTTLTGTSVLFSWTAGCAITQYYLYVGTIIGANDIFGTSQGTSTTATVTNLPINGSTLYVRLWSFVNVASANLTTGWHFIDYTYTASGPGPLRFVPVTPCRIADTRNATGPYGGPSLAASVARNFNIQAGPCGIPAVALAYSLNLTVVPLGTLGFLSVWPAGQTQPVVSTLNSIDGRIKANAAIVPAGTNGGITLFASHPTHVIVDINGYFVPVSLNNNLQFYPLTPCRIADTRSGTGLFGAPGLSAGVARDFPLLSGSCAIPATAQAYALNMTVIPSGPLGFLTAWPAGSPQPGSSTLNAPTGAITANAAIVQAGTGGSITLIATQTTNVIVDINGYFAPPGAGGLQFYTAKPCRIVDTRGATSPFGGPQLSASVQRSFVVAASNCGIPTAAGAFSLNATVVPPAALGFLTLWGAGNQPTVSTLNAGDGSIVANAAFVPASTTGAVTAIASHITQLILDINGYFAQ